jgi:hypothetical protein
MRPGSTSELLSRDTAGSGDRVSAPKDSLAGQDAPRENRSEAATVVEQVVAASTAIRSGLFVRSSMEFELPFIEWQTREGDWKRADLDHGHCELGSIALPCRVRAPGHAPALVAKDGDEIVLEPDALLTLEADGLRACLLSLGPSDDYVADHENESVFRPEYRRAIAWRWISDDR